MALLSFSRPQEDGIYYYGDPDDTFERHYLSVRRKEGRLYTDEEIRRLPFASAPNPHRAEWRLRQQSFRRLKKRLDRSSTRGPVLDLGCGNGWLSRHLGAWFTEEVVGLDVVRTELIQAARLNRYSHVAFVCGNIFETPFPANAFRYIILNASAQYFPSLEALLDRLLVLLAPDGEIHILDTPFYAQAELTEARQRTQHYYQQMGKEDMARHYHHRSWAELEGFDYEVRYSSRNGWPKIIRRLQRPRNPFPWVQIRRRKEGATLPSADRGRNDR